MAGVFDIKTGAFDSSEAAALHQAYDIALHGLKATHVVDRPMDHRLARSIVKVARNETDCLRNDGTIDPVILAQRAILRMLQTSAPAVGFEVPAPRQSLRERLSRLGRPVIQVASETPARAAAESPAKIMLRLFERTPFAKL